MIRAVCSDSNLEPAIVFDLRITFGSRDWEYNAGSAKARIGTLVVRQPQIQPALAGFWRRAYRLHGGQVVCVRTNCLRSGYHLQSVM